MWCASLSVPLLHHFSTLHILANPSHLLADDDVGMKWKVYGSLISGAEYVVVARIRTDRAVFVVTCHKPP